MAVDERSERNIATLDPKVQPLARRLVEISVARGLNIKVIDGSRTYAEQDKIYAQGRTAPGQIVTHAKGGYSLHNFGIAFDVGLFSENGKEYIPESPKYAEVGAIGRTIGLEWGGDWQFVDEPHFQFNPDKLSLAQMRDRKEAGLAIC